MAVAAGLAVKQKIPRSEHWPTGPASIHQWGSPRYLIGTLWFQKPSSLVVHCQEGRQLLSNESRKSVRPTSHLLRTFVFEAFWSLCSTDLTLWLGASRGSRTWGPTSRMPRSNTGEVGLPAELESAKESLWLPKKPFAGRPWDQPWDVDRFCFCLLAARIVSAELARWTLSSLIEKH